MRDRLPLPALAAGGGQSAAGGATLPSPIVVQVVDAFGNAVAVAGRTVNVAIVAGGGSVSPTTGPTNAAGQFFTTWTLGPVAGTQTINATSAGLTSLTVAATATSGRRGRAGHAARIQHAAVECRRGRADLSHLKEEWLQNPGLRSLPGPLSDPSLQTTTPSLFCIYIGR